MQILGLDIISGLIKVLNFTYLIPGLYFLKVNVRPSTGYSLHLKSNVTTILSIVVEIYNYNSL